MGQLPFGEPNEMRSVQALRRCKTESTVAGLATSVFGEIPRRRGCASSGMTRFGDIYQGLTPPPPRAGVPPHTLPTTSSHRGLALPNE
jgi:hypothetical protein